MIKMTHLMTNSTIHATMFKKIHATRHTIGLSIEIDQGIDSKLALLQWLHQSGCFQMTCQKYKRLPSKTLLPT